MKLSVTYSGPKGSAFEWLSGVFQEISEDAQESVVRASETGASEIRKGIKTRGISPKAGRIETGRMLDSVDSKVLSKSKDRVAAEFGWIDTFEDYFGYQEGGFNHWLSGKRVEGMYAVSDAAKFTWEELKSELAEVMKSA